MKNHIFLQQKYIVNTYPNRQIVLTKGNGIYLYDELEVKYLDMMTNYGVNIFGYCHPVITQAITNQLKRLVNLHGSFNNDTRSTAAELLIKKCESNLSQVYFSNSGAEANEAALKFIALVMGNKRKIIACNHSYHGKTIGALSVTHGEKYRKPFEPYPWQVEFIEYNNPDALEKAIDDNTAAFIVEPVQGEGGILVPDDNYLKNVKEICQKKNIIFILDEIQSGCGRTGKFLACQWSEVNPDILTLGKGIAGGLPVGLTLVNERVSSFITKNIHTSTFGGNPLTCAGIIATLNLLDEKLLKHVEEIGNYFIRELKNIKSPLISDVRGKGLMIGVEVPLEKRNLLLKKSQDNFILTIPAGDNVVRFLPPFIIEKSHVDQVVKTFKKILKSVIPA
jgi:predicted acetylornithine/succinylornithine family transaminase